MPSNLIFLTKSGWHHEAEGGDHVNLSDKIKNILSAQLSVEPTDLMDSTSFDDLNADSLDVVELIMALEEEFDIEIPDEDAEKIHTVGDVTEYIKDRIN
jgi:acyl carrier protein